MQTTRPYRMSRPGTSAARAAGAAAVLAMAGLAAPAAAQNKDWTVLDGTWSTAGHWSPFGVPGAGNVVRIGNLGAVMNSEVRLTAAATAGGLQVSDGMRVDTEGWPLSIVNDTLLTGWNSADGFAHISSVLVRNGAAAADFTTWNLSLQEGGQLRLFDGAAAVVGGLFSIGADSRLSAWGTVQLAANGGTALRNDGYINPIYGPLVLNQVNDGGIDLDGLTGTGWVQLPYFSGWDVTVNAASLTDTFSGNIQLAGPSSLHMNIAGGWEADAQSEISVGGHEDYPGPSQITGGPVSFGGLLRVVSGPAHLRVTAPATFLETASLETSTDDTVELAGTATVLGGAFQLGQGSMMEFLGPTTVRGGVFSTVSANTGDGAVRFWGETEWNGTVTINGAARQLGHATVAGPTVINAGLLDMDGAPEWDVNASCVINAQSIDSGPGDSFDSAISIAGGFLGRLNLNLEDPAAEWTMAGEMNIAGDSNFFVVRLGGSPVRVTGELNITGVRSQINAPITLGAGSATTLALPTTVLRLNGPSQIEAPAVLLGGGTLQNGPAGAMNLGHAASLGLVGLVNESQLDIAGEAAGVATVNRFTNAAGGALRLDVGGDPGDSDHDLLVVTGQATLDGALEVRIGGPSAPRVGDTYTVLTTGGGVSGTFLADPVSEAGGLTYEWETIYAPGSVQLRLERIVRTPTPCPADWNGDGANNSNDISAFLTTWLESVNAANLLADLNSDGAVNSNDISAFLTAWLQAVQNGC